MADSDSSTNGANGVDGLLELAIPGPLTFGPRGETEPFSIGPAPTAGRVVGDFRLIEEIGQGGMGQVWKAVQLSLQREVAIKFVRPERVTPKRLEYFEREARAGGRLSHPGLVAIHAYGESDGLAWIAMELVDQAWSLRDFLNDAKQGGELPANYDLEVARVIGEIASAMQAAHEAGVIHRDLKPQNVLVDKVGRVKVTDFGLARISGETGISQTGDVVGTYQYMSPEQIAGKKLDERSDVFSLGVLLYELLTLQRPFQGDTATQVAEQIRTHSPADPREFRSKVGADLAVITLKALEKRADDRYASMGALASDLGRYRRSEPIEARPPGVAGRWARWGRRHPLRAAAVLLVALALTVGAAILDGFRRVEIEATQAELLRTDEFALQGILESESELRPLHPSTLDRIETWLVEAGRLMERRTLHEDAWNDFFERELASGTATREPNPEVERTMERLTSVRESLIELEERIAVVEERRARIRRLLDRTVDSDSARSAWRTATEAIRTSPHYGGLELEPQFGLLPIGPGPHGHWEFLHLPTGRDDCEDWVSGSQPSLVQHGCVLVLLPAGRDWIGCSRVEGGRDYEPTANSYEGPPFEVEVDPFFIGKYEFTQGQWEVLTGERPSYFSEPEPWQRLPVEQVSWTVARPVIRPVGLRFVGEYEWEYAARAGTSTGYPAGTPLWTYANVKDFDNIAQSEVDKYLKLNPDLSTADMVQDRNGTRINAFRDGFKNTAPVGSFTPNGFGLFDMSGNVQEWCEDRFGVYPSHDRPLPSNLNMHSHQVMRGGGYHRSSWEARVTHRGGEIASFAFRALGFRAARSLD